MKLVQQDNTSHNNPGTVGFVLFQFILKETAVTEIYVCLTNLKDRFLGPWLIGGSYPSFVLLFLFRKTIGKILKIGQVFAIFVNLMKIQQFFENI